MMFSICLLFSIAFGASSGATVCDALGICAVTSSGAHNDTETGELKCPWGMHLVGAPTRSDDYLVSTADVGEEGPTSYKPGELMDIHIRVLNPMKKFLGILLYAVQNDGVLGTEGCPSPGCDGKDEVKVGSWEETDNIFQVGCGGQAMTHREASIKNYHHMFRWRAPPAGSGDVIFRVIVKQGSTNGGFFYWPMTAGDLMLFEDNSEDLPNELSGEKWIPGDILQTCTQICNAQNRACDRSVSLNGTLDLYDEMKPSLSCQRPLLSTCTKSAPTRDQDGFCWFENRDSGCEDSNPESANICDIKVENSPGSERLCPCGESLPPNANASNENGSSSSVGIAFAGIGVVVVLIAIAAFCFYNYFSREKKSHVTFDPESQQPGAGKQIEGMVSPTVRYLDGLWGKN